MLEHFSIFIIIFSFDFTHHDFILTQWILCAFFQFVLVLKVFLTPKSPPPFLRQYNMKHFYDLLICSTRIEFFFFSNSLLLALFNMVECVYYLSLWVCCMPFSHALNLLNIFWLPWNWCMLLRFTIACSLFKMKYAPFLASSGGYTTKNPLNYGPPEKIICRAF